MADPNREETAKFLSVDGIAMLLRAMPLEIFGLPMKAHLVFGRNEKGNLTFDFLI